MKIHHILPHINEEASGPSYSVPSLCDALTRLGSQVTLHVLAPKPAHETSFNIATYQQWPFLKCLGISSSMRRGLREAAASADLFHNHSLWMMPNVYPAWATRRTGCRLVVAPRGTLEPWSLRHSRWRKRAMWTALQRAAVEEASCLHVTAESELHSIRKLGLRAPVAVIPNGVDVPAHTSRTLPSGTPRRLLFLGRLHPKKGLENLIRAWSRVHRRFVDWELRIVGRDQYGYRAKLTQLVRALGAQRVHFCNPVYGEEKSVEYHNADLFVLPTHSENFGMTVAEALAHGTPVICTNGAPWPQLNSRACGWWIDIGVEPLVVALIEGLSRPEQALAERGGVGRRWMEEDFGWAAIAQKTQRLYQWLLGGGVAPDFVDACEQSKAA